MKQISSLPSLVPGQSFKRFISKLYWTVQKCYIVCSCVYSVILMQKFASVYFYGVYCVVVLKLCAKWIALYMAKLDHVLYFFLFSWRGKSAFWRLSLAVYVVQVSQEKARTFPLEWNSEFVYYAVVHSYLFRSFTGLQSGLHFHFQF